MSLPEESNQFFRLLRVLDEGNLPVDLHTAIGGLVQAVKNTGKGGKLTITIAVKPTKGNSERVLFDPTLKVTEPKIETSTTLMYVSDDGSLSREDPRQPKLPGHGPAEVRRFVPDQQTAAAGGED